MSGSLVVHVGYPGPVTVLELEEVGRSEKVHMDTGPIL